MVIYNNKEILNACLGSQRLANLSLGGGELLPTTGLFTSGD